MTPDLPVQIMVGDHISLRALETKDAARLFRLTERNQARLKQWLPWVENTKTSVDTLRFIQGAVKAFSEKTALHMGILFRGQLAGVVGLRYVDWVNSKTELGYWIGSEFSGRGIMVMSCRALVDYLFKELKLNRVEILTEPRNAKSQAIAKKLGFTEEGLLRESGKLYDKFVDHLVYSMLAKEWGKIG
ncbi:MAG: GNAT family N-acetyltransferase [Elusimicrobia bacterium]|nr:GNAT family N-acetyltransferase [Elusimicrobiota bacterium]